MLTDTDFWRRVTVVTVTYNSEAVIGECLRYLPSEVACYVIDNASLDRSVDVVLGERPFTAVYRLRHNVGYGRANNFALRRTDTEFALLLNPDGFISPAHLAALVRVAIANPQYALISPALTKTDRDLAIASPANEPTIEDMLEIPGAIVLMRLDAGEQIGFFDEEFFLYGEDNDLCASLVKAGWKVATVHGVVGFHRGNASSAYEPNLQIRKNILMGRAVAHYRRKWVGGRFWRLQCLRRSVGHCLKAIVNLLKLKRAHASWHLGRAIGAILYLSTSATGPIHRPQVDAVLGECSVPQGKGVALVSANTRTPATRSL